MKNRPELTAYIETPELLAKLCMDVIEQVDDQQFSPGLDEIEPQLREVAYAIDKLEKAGTSVPDELRQLKTGLVAKLAVRDQIIGRLKALEGCLEKALQDLRLRIGKTKSPNYRRPSNEPATSREVLREEIVRALKILGGSGSPKEVGSEIEKNLEGKLLPRDKEKMSNGQMAWYMRCKKERERMVQDGILKSDSPIGVWELRR